MLNKKITVVLEGDDSEVGHSPFSHPGVCRQLICPHPWKFAHLKKQKAYGQGLPRRGGGGGQKGNAGID